MSSSSMARHLPLAEKARAYLTASTDPFHAVANAVAKLEAAGFVKVFQQKQQQAAAASAVKIQPGGKYYYTVHHSTLVAFTVGQKYTPGNGGFHIIGGHTDSPNLHIKPRSKKGTGGATAKTVQLGVECYGGGLWHTWFDRDLSISGKVVLRQKKKTANDKETTTTTTTFTHKLVQLTEPVARVSTLCIHLQSDNERKAFAVNKEDHTAPIVASSSSSIVPSSLLEPNKALEDGATMQINEKDSTAAAAAVAATVEDEGDDPWTKGQEPLLLKKIAEKLGVEASQIADWDLSLYDAQGAALGGMNSEFLYSGRLDNLATVFCAVEALTEHATTPENMAADSDIAMICCFDHEEVGSSSAHGAGSPVLEDAIQRVSVALMGRKSGNGNDDDDDDTLMVSPERQARTIAKSFCLSIDQAHAIHPNYASKHEANHSPTLNSGIVIKTNWNQRYATNSLTGFFVREIGKRCGVPVQEFVVRNDCPCGSTIGPIISTRTGIRTVDAGMPQLSMHSCREVMGIADLTHGVELFKGFFKHFRSVDESFQDD